MNGNERNNDAKLEALDIFVIDQLVNGTDDEILDQAEPGDAVKVEDAFQKAKLAAGKSRMAHARAAMAAASKKTTVIPFDPVQMRQRLNSLVKPQEEHGQRLTIAARGAKGNVDEDDEGILEDLNDLLGDDDGKKSP